MAAKQQSTFKQLEKVVVFLGIVALVELGVFRLVYNDVWLLNWFIAHPDPQQVATLDKIYASAMQGPQDTEKYEKLMKLATAYYKVGNNTRIVAIYRRVLQSHPENREVRLELAKTLQRLGRYGEAAREYERLLHTRP